MEVGSEDAFRGGVVGRYADSAGWLSVVEFGQCGDDGDCLLAADEDSDCFCFGYRGDHVLEFFQMSWMAPLSGGRPAVAFLR